MEGHARPTRPQILLLSYEYNHYNRRHPLEVLPHANALELAELEPVYNSGNTEYARCIDNFTQKLWELRSHYSRHNCSDHRTEAWNQLKGSTTDFLALLVLDMDKLMEQDAKSDNKDTKKNLEEVDNKIVEANKTARRSIEEANRKMGESRTKMEETGRKRLEVGVPGAFPDSTTVTSPSPAQRPTTVKKDPSDSIFGSGVKSSQVPTSLSNLLSQFSKSRSPAPETKRPALSPRQPTDTESTLKKVSFERNQASRPAFLRKASSSTEEPQPSRGAAAFLPSNPSIRVQAEERRKIQEVLSGTRPSSVASNTAPSRPADKTLRPILKPGIPVMKEDLGTQVYRNLKGNVRPTGAIKPPQTKMARGVKGQRGSHNRTPVFDGKEEDVDNHTRKQARSEMVAHLEGMRMRSEVQKLEDASDEE